VLLPQTIAKPGIPGLEEFSLLLTHYFTIRSDTLSSRIVNRIANSATAFFYGGPYRRALGWDEGEADRDGKKPVVAFELKKNRPRSDKPARPGLI
jgi:hypothetical protein